MHLFMDEKKLVALWKNVLAEIETEVSKANYLTLFKPTALIELNDNNAVIASPSSMALDLLKKRFGDLISVTIEKHIHKKIEVTFISKIVQKNSPEEEKIGPLFADEKQQVQIIGHLPRVRPEYVFSNMAVSSSNQLAFISAQTVAKSPGTSYNPLFIYGPVGVGKTHLMQAIANEVYQKDPNKKIIYISSEEFTNEVVEAIRSNDTAKMKRRFRNIDLLLIDDIQFIAGKDRVQEELFHTFNILIDNRAQIVFSSDRPPHEIKKLETRLSSRFAGGLTVDIEAPDFELRTAIVLIKAKKYDVDLPIEAAKVVAEKNFDVRSLEGALLKIVTIAKTQNIEINEEMSKKILGGNGETKENNIHPDDVIKNVCDYYRIKPTQLKGPKRDAFLVKARQITMYVLKKELALTLIEIGNYLGGRDHTTIMYGVDKVENLLSTNPKIASEVLGIKKLISG
jgi:chromosomal replication initiator protein